MNELITAKKNKISLSDYNYKQDIKNRCLLGTFSLFDHSVLEEILFGSVKIPLLKIAKNLDSSVEQIIPSLQKIAFSCLITFDQEFVLVDKEVRKYFETQMVRYEPNFKPDVDFLQNLLSKVPIHILPLWYATPRTSSNIFESILEKYLLTPQIYQRYLSELQFSDPVLSGMAQDVFRSENLELPASYLMQKYELSLEKFQENMLLLEFNLVCCLTAIKTDDSWQEVVTPFHEWRQYLLFNRNTAPKSIKPVGELIRKRPNDFSFVQDMGIVLSFIRKSPLVLDTDGIEKLKLLVDKELEGAHYIERIVQKLRQVKLAELKGDVLESTSDAGAWIEMRLEARAIHLYRHFSNKLQMSSLSKHLETEKALREAEKTISKVLYSEWIFFEDFFKGVMAVFEDSKKIVLKRSKRSWSYELPVYSDEEKLFVKKVIFEWLFEIGVTAPGLCAGKECFMVTPFGQSLFGQ